MKDLLVLPERGSSVPPWVERQLHRRPVRLCESCTGSLVLVGASSRGYRVRLVHDQGCTRGEFLERVAAALDVPPEMVDGPTLDQRDWTLHAAWASLAALLVVALLVAVLA